MRTNQNKLERAKERLAKFNLDKDRLRSYIDTTFENPKNKKGKAYDKACRKLSYIYNDIRNTELLIVNLGMKIIYEKDNEENEGLHDWLRI